MKKLAPATYVYDGVSMRLYQEMPEHFVSIGTHDCASQAEAYIQVSGPYRLATVSGSTMSGRTVFEGGEFSGLHRRFLGWQDRTPCPSHSSGTWGYDKECLLPAGHAGEHKHGTVGWRNTAHVPDGVLGCPGILGPQGTRASSDQVMLFIEIEVSGGQYWLVSRCGVPHWALYFIGPVSDHEIDRLVDQRGYAGWALRCRSGGIRCSNAAHLNVHALLDKEWQDWTNVCEPAPAPVAAAHCMVPHPTSEGPCMNPSGHPGPHRALSGFEWPRAGTLSVSNPDSRPAPEGHCSFCAANPANHWGSNDWKICASADCSAAHHFHEDRCQSGSVDTPETRAESLRYGRQWLLEKAFEDAQKKPEGSCAFCAARAEERHPDCLVAVCGKHEREAWRLTHRLELGGVSDTPQLREEVLRHVEASDAFLREKQCEEHGARTEHDHGALGYRYPELTQQKSPPEEIHLVGTTPHYEWP